MNVYTIGSTFPGHIVVGIASEVYISNVKNEIAPNKTNGTLSTYKVTTYAQNVVVRPATNGKADKGSRKRTITLLVEKKYELVEAGSYNASTWN
jgi:hypothetical protein